MRESQSALKFFDEKLLRELIHLHVAPDVFEKDAFKRLLGYNVRDEENKRVIAQAANESLRVGAKFVKGFGWVCGLLFLLVAVWSWLDGEVKESLFLLIFNDCGELFSAQIETRCIEVKETTKALWRLNKNTKIKSKSS